MSPVVALACLMGVLGLAIGSFLNVVIYRVPAQLSIVSPGSHCPQCEVPIKGRHNVPVVGWLVLRGRCASCSTSISARYPLVEAVTGALFVVLTLHFGATATLPAFLYLAAAGVTLAMIDLDTRWLPDSIVLPSYVISILLFMPAAAADGDWHNAWHGLVGMAALATMVGLLAAVHPGLGIGDVKLAGLLGLCLGWLSWQSLLVTAVISVLALGVSELRVSAGRRLAHLPIGSCLIGAAALALFLTGPCAHLYRTVLPS